MKNKTKNIVMEITDKMTDVICITIVIAILATVTLVGAAGLGHAIILLQKAEAEEIIGTVAEKLETSKEFHLLIETETDKHLIEVKAEHFQPIKEGDYVTLEVFRGKAFSVNPINIPI